MKISELPDCPDWLASAETQNADVVWQNGTIVWFGGEWRGEWLGKGEAPNAR